MDFTVIKENLENLGYKVSCFETAKAAADYLDSQIDDKSVGFGGSVTLDHMGLYEMLSKHNDVRWHWRIQDGKSMNDMRDVAARAEIYISSVNGMAETGEIINIDGTGNRVAAICYGHKKVYLVAGKNKIEKDFDRALWRARNIAAPLNAKRLEMKTPCAAAGDKCYNCKSPARICRELSVLWQKPLGAEYEVVLINEELGF